jgi:hypothetical protein
MAIMEHDVLTVLAEVVRIAPTLHKAGTFSAATLHAIVRHASASPVAHSVETGSGASTLLLSHVSSDHTVFAVDAGTNSVRAIEFSPLLRRDVVTFVEGPTQVTLPLHAFKDRLQLALIDGPHGFPFPDLEYYYLYPQLDRDALLIVDDIHIPTVGNLFDFISADEMFALQEVVETTAFFRRTNAPTFSPIGDGWWNQRYNKRAFEATAVELLVEAPPRRVDVATPFYVDQLGPFMDPLALASLRVRRNEQLGIAGWALDVRQHRPAVAVDLVLDDRVYRTVVRIPRADVAAAHGDQGYFRCGFSAWFPPGVITGGSHRLEIRIVLSGGREYYSAALLNVEAL